MRRFARGCVWAVFGLFAAALGPGLPEQAADGFALTEAAPGVFAAIAQPGNDSAIGNAGFIIGSDAVLVVDSFATPRAAQQLLAQIRRRTHLPVRWLVNTHHHLDHCGGNSELAKAGAVVVAHENARSAMRAAALARMAPANSPEKEKSLRGFLPSETYRDSLSIWLGERRVDVFSQPGHTAGDSLVWVPDANVLFGGDLVQKATVPNLSDAKTDAWVQTLDALALRFPSAILVPGHGAVARPLDMRALRDYLAGLRLAVARELQRGDSGAALSDALLPQLRSQYRAWTWSERIGDNLAQVEAELTGKKAFAPAPTP
ncbi:MAG: MBL fold metallo-hydrolase [Acidobacteriota bacterium]